jgi:hypothetical protein
MNAKLCNTTIMTQQQPILSSAAATIFVVPVRRNRSRPRKRTLNDTSFLSHQTAKRAATVLHKARTATTYTVLKKSTIHTFYSMTTVATSVSILQNMS